MATESRALYFTSWSTASGDMRISVSISVCAEAAVADSNRSASAKKAKKGLTLCCLLSGKIFNYQHSKNVCIFANRFAKIKLFLQT